MQGRGERVTPLHGMPTLHFLLLCPEESVLSGACYRKYDELAAQNALQKGQNATQACIETFLQKDVNGGGMYLSNDLYAPAKALCPAVGEAMAQALSFSPIGAVMTGSGSCVAALFETPELCEWAKSRYYGKYRATVVKTVEPSQSKVWKNPFALNADEGK